ncbi:MAG: hypothetical protein AAF581_20970 [Planctomycetota bacterium]
MPWPKRPVAGVDAQLRGDGSIHHQQRRTGMCGRLHGEEVERRIEHRFDGRQHHHVVLRSAPGHDGVHCQRLDGDDAVLGWHGSELVIRGAVGAGDHPRDPLGSGWHGRKAVAPAAGLEFVVKGFLIVAEFDQLRGHD